MVSVKRKKEKFVEKLKRKYTLEEVVEMLLFETVADAQEILDREYPGHTLVEVSLGVWAIKNKKGSIVTSISRRR